MVFFSIIEGIQIFRECLLSCCIDDVCLYHLVHTLRLVGCLHVTILMGAWYSSVLLVMSGLGKGLYLLLLSFCNFL